MTGLASYFLFSVMTSFKEFFIFSDVAFIANLKQPSSLLFFAFLLPFCPGSSLHYKQPSSHFHVV